MHESRSGAAQRRPHRITGDCGRLSDGRLIPVENIVRSRCRAPLQAHAGVVRTMRGASPSRSPGYFHKEISMWYTADTVQPGTAMTVKEMGACLGNGAALFHNA